MSTAVSQPVVHWLGALSTAMCNLAFCLADDKFPGAKTAMEYAYPATNPNDIERLLTEIARHESFITEDALNKSSGADGYWQLLVTSRSWLRDKYAPWLVEWPDRRTTQAIITPTVQGEYCGAYLARVLANLGTQVDFTHGPVKVRGTADGPKNWSHRLAEIGKIIEKKAGKGSTTAADLLHGCIYGFWAKGNLTWPDDLINRAATAALAVKKKTTIGSVK